MQGLLLNKYEPKNIYELNLDKNLLTLFETLITINNLNLLLVGNSGTCKSTLINTILYKYYNVTSLSKLEDNILYINNLKEQGISYYKNEVKIFCQSLSDINNKKKTIVLDDIDLLNDQSQQIFKIHMDNFHNNINFIASCSNINKITESVQSHLLQVKLTNINYDYLENIYEKICKNENLLINNSFKETIIKSSNNSIKCLINNLEKIRIIGTKDLETNVNIINNNFLYNDIDKYFNKCLNKELIEGLNILLKIYEEGYSVVDIIYYLYLYIKYKNSIDDNIKYRFIKVISNYILMIHNLYEESLILFFVTYDIINDISNSVTNCYSNDTQNMNNIVNIQI